METLIEEEKSTIFEQPIIAPKDFAWVRDEAMAVIFHTSGDDVDICGKTKLEWVQLACVNMLTKVVDEPKDEDFFSTLKNLSAGKKFVVVLYSNTPLLKQNTILEALDYISSKNVNAIMLPKGFIFKSEYLSGTMVSTPVRKNIAPEQFEEIDSPNAISGACEKIWDEIRMFHKNNGIVLKGENTIFIDADVVIESGTIIEPNNIIKGHSTIGQNVMLKSGNYIEDSIVASGETLVRKTIINGEII